MERRRREGVLPGTTVGVAFGWGVVDTEVAAVDDERGTGRRDDDGAVGLGMPLDFPLIFNVWPEPDIVTGVLSAISCRACIPTKLYTLITKQRCNRLNKIT